MTYIEISECSTISVSDWPIPDVSKIIKSKLAALRILIASFTWADKARLACLVAKDLIYTLGDLIEFILILSPSRAPPVFLLDGSTEIIAISFFSKSNINLLTSSSTSEDLPAPPVPVIPKTGVFDFDAKLLIFEIVSLCNSG